MAEEMDAARVVEQEALQYQKAMNAVIDRGDSNIQQYYKDATVFVTGAGGFLGKQLVEKLFRSTALKKVYVVMRPKKGNSVKERLTSMLKDPVFDTIRQKKSDFESRLEAIEGDMQELRLGISDGDWAKLSEEVTVIIHMAATVRFDAHIKVAALTNVRGTREVIKLARDCSKLKSLVYVSTAFTHATMPRRDTELMEQFYPAPVPPDVIIEMAETVDEKRLEDMTPALIKDWPNTYTFTKAIAEELVRISTDGLPICVVKPPVVMPAYTEPSPGWTDTTVLFNMGGVVLGVGLGILHTFLTRVKNILNLAPVDIVNNAIIAAAWDSEGQRKKGEQIPIYAVSGEKSKIDWDFIGTTLRKDKTRRLVPANAVWLCFMFETANPFLYWAMTWYFHLIPAYIIDGLCKLFGIKIKQIPSFVKFYKKIYNASQIFAPFLLSTWHFRDDNLVKMIDRMSDNDKAIYNCDVNTIDYDKYIGIYSIGLRKYILKDELKDSAKGYRNQKIFYYLNIAFNAVYIYVLFTIAYYLFLGVKYIVF